MRGRVSLLVHSGPTALLRATAIGAWLVVGGCGGSGDQYGGASSTVVPPPVSMPPPVSQPPVSPPPPAQPAPGSTVGRLLPGALHGRFVGTLAGSPGNHLPHEHYFGDAVITSDGHVRLYVGERYSDSGAIQVAAPGQGLLFVGRVAVVGNMAAGTGVVLAHECGASEECSGPWPATIAFAADSRGISGNLRVQWASDRAEEDLPMRLGAWDETYVLAATDGFPVGHYREALARFAAHDDTVITIDVAGRVQFQSASSGCIGNGLLTPHGDGSYFVFAMELEIDGCRGELVDLIGQYSGLATMSPSSAWDYDGVLRAWLAKSGGVQAVALTLWAPPV